MVNFYMNRIRKGIIKYYSEVAVRWRDEVREASHAEGIYLPEEPEEA